MRRKILTAAWLAAGNGQHTTAARLFALVGLDYDRIQEWGGSR